MYEYVTDKQFIRKIRQLYGKIMQDICHELKEDYDIGAIFYLVGSVKENLILQNGTNPIDIDYDLEIVRCEDYENCENIKESVIRSTNKVLKRYGIQDCEDSTSSITTKKIQFIEGNCTEFSMDIGIVCQDEKGNKYRLIHKKTGCVIYDSYYWKEVPNTQKLRKKVIEIQSAGMWKCVYKGYRDTKNRYLINNDYNHTSFICYIETINNVYNQIKYCRRK